MNEDVLDAERVATDKKKSYLPPQLAHNAQLLMDSKCGLSFSRLQV